jgi:toxic protein SymE
VNDLSDLKFIHMNSRKTRQAKLHGKYRSLQRGWPAGKYVPWLNVNGVWLEQAGFKVGDRLEITVANNMLTIKNLGAHGDH